MVGFITHMYNNTKTMTTDLVPPPAIVASAPQFDQGTCQVDKYRVVLVPGAKAWGLYGGPGVCTFSYVPAEFTNVSVKGARPVNSECGCEVTLRASRGPTPSRFYEYTVVVPQSPCVSTRFRLKGGGWGYR